MHETPPNHVNELKLVEICEARKAELCHCSTFCWRTYVLVFL